MNLRSSGKWSGWLEAIRKMAESKHIWVFIDPDQMLELAQQVLTSIPKPASHDTLEGPSRWDLINYHYDRKAYDDKVKGLTKLDVMYLRPLLRHSGVLSEAGMESLDFSFR